MLKSTQLNGECVILTAASQADHQAMISILSCDLAHIFLRQVRPQQVPR